MMRFHRFLLKRVWLFGLGLLVVETSRSCQSALASAAPTLVQPSIVRARIW